MNKIRLVKRADFIAQEQAKLQHQQSLQQARTMRSNMIFAVRDFIHARQECNANAKQQFAALFTSAEEER